AVGGEVELLEPLGIDADVRVDHVELPGLELQRPVLPGGELQLELQPQLVRDDPGDVDLGADVGLVVVGQEAQRRRGSAVDAHAQHAGPGDLRRQERGDGLVGLRADQLLSAGGVDRGGVVPATVGRRRARAGPAGRGGRRIGAGGEEADGKHQPGRGDSAARGPETSGGESAGHEGSSEVGGPGESVGASGRTRWRKERVRSWAGWSMTWAGGPCSTIRPWSMNTTVSATSRAKEISCVTIT